MKRRTRRLSITIKVCLTTSIMMILLAVLLGVNSYMRTKDDMVSMGMEQAQVAAKVAAKQIDGTAIAKLKAGDENSKEYEEMRKALQGIKGECGVAYLYTLSTDKQAVYYGIDTDESKNRALIGKKFDYSYEELKTVFEGNTYVQDYIDSTADGDLITVYVPIMDNNNQVVAVLGSDYDASKIVERLDGLCFRVVQISIFGLLIAILLLNFVIGKIMKSLWVVNGKIHELVHSKGDLTQTLDIKSGDEMEVMAGNVNELLKYIREIMIRISQNSSSLKDSTKVVVDNLTNAGENIVDVSATMEEMSAAMEETTASIHQVNESIAEVYGHINNITEKAVDGSSVTKEIQNKAKQIHEKAEEEQQNAYNLAEEMITSINKQIEKSKSVEEINLLTENIIGITEQTNLLALNASIEAARAGEAGKGFAVVADEIGKLASNSADAAVRIQNVSKEVISAVEGLSAEAEKMVSFMEETAMKGFRQLLSTSDSYYKDVEEIHNTMKKFADSSEELEQLVNAIKEAIQSVNIAVEESTNGIVNISETSAGLAENVEDIEKKADENQQIAEQLEEEVNQFKLE